MKTNDASFLINTYRSRIIHENVANSNFTREDYVGHFNVVNEIIKLISLDTIGYNSKYPFIVVWQRYE